MSRPVRKPETNTFLKNIVIHPELDRALDAIKTAHATSGSKPQGTIIYGESGVGKTTVINEYIREFPPVEIEDRTCMPVVVIETQAGQNTKSVMQELLEAMDIICPPRATQTTLFSLIRRAFSDLGVELVICDEFQELLPQKTKDSPNIMRFIKKLMNQTGVPWVLVGTTPTRQVLETSDNQLRRRFNGAYKIAPFSMTTEDEREDFVSYIALVQEVLPVKCYDLTEENMLLRLFTATGGIPGYISNLFEKLIECWDGQSRATLELFSEAYQRAFVGCGDTFFGANVPFDPFLESITTVKNYQGKRK